MKVFYKTIRRGRELFPTVFIKLETKFCCKEMESAYGNAIKFGEWDTTLNTSNKLNIFECIPYPEGACWTEHPISYCPFCGQKIETIEKERVKLITKKIKEEREIEQEIEVKDESGTREIAPNTT